MLLAKEQVGVERRPVRHRAPTPEAADNVSRIEAMWTDCRKRFGAGGPFLFGAFGAADAMYAPVCTRFITYDVALDPVSAGYCRTVMAMPLMQEWLSAAKVEPDELEELDVEF